MNSSTSNMNERDIRNILVLEEIDSFINAVKNKITDYNEKLELLQEAKKLYNTFRNNMIWILGKHKRKDFYTHDYIEILDRMKNEIDNKHLIKIIEGQREKVNEKINNTREKFNEMEKSLLKQFSLNKKMISLLQEKIRPNIERIRKPEENTIKIYMKLLDLQKDLLKDINENDIRTFAKNYFARTPTEFVDIDTAKENITLLLLHYILGKNKDKDDLFYLIEEALYSRKIPLRHEVK